jgi:hypothetical protein
VLNAVGLVFVAAAAAPPDKPVVESPMVQVKDLTPVKIHQRPQHAPVPIVSDGIPRAKVFLADEHPSRNLALLVKELLDAIKLSTGADLEVVRQLPVPDAPAIVIGDCDAARAARIDAARIPIEGFVVKTAPNRVYLVGSTAPLPTVTNISDPYSNDGTAWAIADFLERFVGVRWYWPAEANGRSVIRMKTLAVAPVHYSDEPVFRKRAHWPPRYTKKDGQWRARWFENNDPVPAGRAVPPGVETIDMLPLLAAVRMGNSWPYMIKVHEPQSLWRNPKLIEQHKAMFAKKEDGSTNFSMLCYSSQETFDFLMDGCERFWTKGQKTASWVTDTAVTISPSDERVHCYCEKCQKLYDPRGGTFGTASRLMAVFVKKFAEEVKRRWPGKMVMYLPYWNYTMCPDDVELPDNVQIQMCTMPFALMREPGERATFEKSFAAWRKKSPNKIQSWEYSNGVTSWTFAPVQYPHVLKDYYSHNRDLLVGSFINGEFLNEWSRTAISLYCWTKVLWNPEVDVDAIMDVYCERMFGKANKTSHELLRMMCDRWEKARWSQGQAVDGRLNSTVYRDTWPPDVVAKMARLWEQARQELQDDPLALQRFEYSTWTFEHFLRESRVQHPDHP